MDWTEEASLRLIDCYRQKELLWNTRIPDHFNKTQRYVAWEEIGEGMGISPEECKKKMSILLASMRRVKSKLRKSLKAGTGETPRCTWFAFKSLQFMWAKNLQRNVSSTINMVRTYKRKSKRPPIDPNVMKMAVEEVRNGQSLRKVAAQFGFNFKTVSNYCKKYRQLEVSNNIQNETTPTVVQTLGSKETFLPEIEPAENLSEEPGHSDSSDFGPFLSENVDTEREPDETLNEAKGTADIVQPGPDAVAAAPEPEVKREASNWSRCDCTIARSEPQIELQDDPPALDSREDSDTLQTDEPRPQPSHPAVSMLRKRQRRLKPSATDARVIAKATFSRRDVFTVFGEFVGDSVRNLQDKRLQSWARHQINNVLYTAEQASFQDSSDTLPVNLFNFDPNQGLATVNPIDLLASGARNTPSSPRPSDSSNNMRILFKEEPPYSDPPSPN